MKHFLWILSSILLVSPLWAKGYLNYPSTSPAPRASATKPTHVRCSAQPIFTPHMPSGTKANKGSVPKQNQPIHR